MKSYLLQAQIQIQSKGATFCIVLWDEVVINCYPNFITCLFPPDLIRSNSGHCQPTEWFKSKESSKESINSDKIIEKLQGQEWV